MSHRKVRNGSTLTWSNANPLERKIDHAVEFAIQSARTLISWLPGGSAYLRNRTVLEVGPGQDLGIPLILMGFGASAILVDRYLCQWDSDFHPLYYRKLRQALADEFPSVEMDSLDCVIKSGSHAVPNLTSMKVGIENIHEVPDSSVDITYSNATFEHLSEPAPAIQELARVTRPGGFGFHQIDFRDHRDFKQPLEYLTVSQDELRVTSMAWSFGNGVRSTEFESMFKEAGFHIIQFEVNLLADEPYLAALRPRLRDKYQSMSPEALRILGGRFHMVKPFSEDPCLHSIFGAFVERGYPIELITTWAPAPHDAAKLVELIEERRPDNILEIGTAVGISTLMMAAKLHEGAVIHAVDPSLPFAAEPAMRPLDLASAVAQRLGMTHKIVFHVGGFSTSAANASLGHEWGETLSPIGAEVCEKYGPFDLIVFNTPHCRLDVLSSDLRLAARHLGPRGRIVIRGVIGKWGSTIRRAVFEFLAEGPEFSFHHERYAESHEGIGVLESVTRNSTPMLKTEGCDTGKSILESQEFTEYLSAVVYNQCLPKSAVYLGHDRGKLLLGFGKLGVKRLFQVSNDNPPSSQLGDNSPTLERFDFGSIYKPNERFDLCICLPDHDGPLCSVHDLVASCAECSDTILFGSTPPGEANISGRRSLPIEQWVREFWQYGYRFYDHVRPHLEPLKSTESSSPIYPVNSSELSNLYLVRRESRGSGKDHEYVGQVLIEKERRVEDLVLQGVFSDMALQHAWRKFKTAQDLLKAKERSQAEGDRIITEQEVLIDHCESRIRQHEDTIREQDERLRRQDPIVGEYRRITQSLEYRAALRFAKYPRLLRFGARVWRLMSGR